VTRRHALVAGLAVLLLLPLALLVRLGWDPLADADQGADVDAHRAVLGNHALLTATRAVTHLGDPLTVTAVAVLAAVGFWWCGRRVDAAYLLVVRAVAVVLGYVLKELVSRARPDLPQPVAHAGGYSFPSGHALGAAAAYLSLALVVARVRPRWARVAVPVAAALAVVVATSRVLLGVHFPSDVAAGLVLGWAIALVARWAEPASPPAAGA
jgi:undecaprenyl-diphosphatase